MGMYLQHNHLAGSPTAVMMEIQNYGDPTGTMMRLGIVHVLSIVPVRTF